MFNNKLAKNNIVQDYGGGVGGYLFNWGVKDHTGNLLTKDTNYHLDWYPQYPILFNHGFSSEVGCVKLGTVYELRKTDSGIMIIGSLDPENEWYEALCVLKSRNTLFWTASPIQHLTKAVDGVWVHYPLSEISLTNLNGMTAEDLKPISNNAS